VQVDAVDPDMAINIEAAALNFRKKYRMFSLELTHIKAMNYFGHKNSVKSPDFFWALISIFDFIF